MTCHLPITAEGLPSVGWRNGEGRRSGAAQPFEPGFEEVVKRDEDAKREMSYICLAWVAAGVPRSRGRRTRWCGGSMVVFIALMMVVVSPFLFPMRERGSDGGERHGLQTGQRLRAEFWRCYARQSGQVGRKYGEPAVQRDYSAGMGETRNMTGAVRAEAISKSLCSKYCVDRGGGLEIAWLM